MAAITAAGLTACGNEAPTPTATAPVAAPASVSSSPPAAPSSAAPAYITKKVGERAGITNTDGSPAVDFWVTKIWVDPKCTPYASRAADKHTLLLDVTVKTYTDRDAESGISAFSVLPGLINPFAFSTTGADGVTNQAEADTCADPKQLPSAYAPNRTYTGQISLSTSAKSGTLQLTDGSGLFGPGAHGWEWSY
ncbi:hypothetical protein [Amycolatopsis sp. SID8362]|uniref:hypothetical protein n=1 Tax=Amycolatopsis sp. SID8362 TaxID=2690346 RepID=UPI0013707E1D|nr:hypothetical protein [Amycolatopsis sp. SID8362]NBH04146.1 hypothetical protein [Amycolatopsis sp. SID8362]NED40845.1 hypothetical protein [Amycolatopsis sp. SID8362]